MSEYAAVSVTESSSGVEWTMDVNVHSLTTQQLSDGLKALHNDGWKLLTATAVSGPAGVLHTLYLER